MCRRRSSRAVGVEFRSPAFNRVMRAARSLRRINRRVPRGAGIRIARLAVVLLTTYICAAITVIDASGISGVSRFAKYARPIRLLAPQSWALFAPNPPTENHRAYVRAVDPFGATPWSPISLVRVREPLTAGNAVSEALIHAMNDQRRSSYRWTGSSAEIIARIAGACIRLRYKTRSFTTLQIRLVTVPLVRGRLEHTEDSPWLPFPHLTERTMASLHSML